MQNTTQPWWKPSHVGRWMINRKLFQLSKERKAQPLQQQYLSQAKAAVLNTALHTK